MTPSLSVSQEWRPLFELFHDRKATRVGSFYAVVVDMPLASDQCVVVGERGNRLHVAFPWDKQAPCVREVVNCCRSFRIGVTCATDVVVRAVLEICDAAFAQELFHSRHLSGEVYVVGLLAASWKDVAVITHAPPRDRTRRGGAPEITLRVDDASCSSSPILHGATAAAPPHHTLDVDAATDPDCYALKPHQRESAQWMHTLEQTCHEPLFYEGNLRLDDEWFVDTEGECLTVDPSWRESFVRGGILADWPGAGKTVIVLHHCAHHFAICDPSRLVARGTLVVLPLNLHAQWLHEAQTFFSHMTTVCMASAKDMKSVTMRDLLAADVVLTTFSFLRASKPYQEMVESAVESALPSVSRRDSRTKTALSMWARLPDRVEPILEAVHWHRVVVDEVHEMFSAVRNAKMLQGLRSTYCWGISATPGLHPDAVPGMYNWLLRREKAYHPNLMLHIERRCVRVVDCPVEQVYERALRLVPAPDDERRDIEGERDVESVVKLCTRVHATDDVEVWDADALVQHHSCAIDDAHLVAEVTHLRTCLADMSEHDSRRVEAMAALADAEAKLANVHGRLDFVKERIRTLEDQAELCPICHSSVCGVILLCGHTFCRQCISKHAQDKNWCPICRAEFRMEDVRGVVLVGAKVRSIADALCDLAEPVIVFAQWKSTLRTMRAVLRGRGLRSFTLDGNVAARTRSLQEFAKGGVLLLNLNDSFAGLHLPHVRHVIFAHAVVGCPKAVESLEKQAIARCLRHGQTRRVYVHSFVISDSVEEELWRTSHPDS